MTDPLSVGVIGVGSMGRNHARVYRELTSTSLVGVADAEPERAQEVADSYETEAVAPEALLEAVDAVSIAVPTTYHYATALEAIERDVDVLVEKPFVARPEHGRALIDAANDRAITLQVGHIERFNPAVRALVEIVPDLEIIAIDAMRLGPPVDREIDVNPVLDLMIHDIDIVNSLIDDEVTRVSATRSPADPYVSATLEFGNGVVGTFTASRVTQQKVRTLSITARTCRVLVDFIDQTVEIHRQSVPEYIEENGNLRFRHQNIVERPTIKNGEPLKAELESFVAAARSGDTPVVTGEDGLAALLIADRISKAMGREEQPDRMEVET